MGDLHIRFPALTVNGAPHQQLVVHQAEPASATAAAFERLRATGSELAAGSHQKASAPPYAWVEFQARRSGVGNPGSVVQSSPAEGATVQRLDHLDNLSRQVAGGSRWPGWDRDRGRAPCPAHESDILLAPVARVPHQGRHGLDALLQPRSPTGARAYACGALRINTIGSSSWRRVRPW
ncbi:hypothetical protein [Streptomyces griseorubiginosus]|uniref:hypothetical protein n=1 Tax=Streptomyces griseorubiginosus TaxID=67304 RepID=UPI003CCC6E07